MRPARQPAAGRRSLRDSMTFYAFRASPKYSADQSSPCPAHAKSIAHCLPTKGEELTPSPFHDVDEPDCNRSVLSDTYRVGVQRVLVACVLVVVIRRAVLELVAHPELVADEQAE